MAVTANHFYAIEIAAILEHGKFTTTFTENLSKLVCDNNVFKTILWAYLPKEIKRALNAELLHEFPKVNLDSLTLLSDQTLLEELTLCTFESKDDYNTEVEFINNLASAANVPNTHTFPTAAPLHAYIQSKRTHECRMIIQQTCPESFKIKGIADQLMNAAISHNNVHAARLLLNNVHVMENCDWRKILYRVLFHSPRIMYLNFLISPNAFIPTVTKDDVAKSHIVFFEKRSHVTAIHAAIVCENLELLNDLLTIAKPEDLHAECFLTAVAANTKLFEFPVFGAPYVLAVGYQYDTKVLGAIVTHPKFSWEGANLDTLYQFLGLLQRNKCKRLSEYLNILIHITHMPIRTDSCHFRELERAIWWSSSADVLVPLLNQPNYHVVLDQTKLDQLDQIQEQQQHPIDLILRNMNFSIADSLKSAFTIRSYNNIQKQVHQIGVIFDLWYPDPRSRAEWMRALVTRMRTSNKLEEEGQYYVDVINQISQLPNELVEMVVHMAADLPEGSLPMADMYDEWVCFLNKNTTN